MLTILKNLNYKTRRRRGFLGNLRARRGEHEEFFSKKISVFPKTPAEKEFYNSNFEMANVKWLKQRGASLVEMLIYIGVLILLLTTVISVIKSFTRSYRFIRSAQNVELSAETSLERMTRSIRDSLSVDSAQSTLGSSPGTLTLNTTDDAGLATTTQFYLSNQKIWVKEGTASTGPISSSATRVTKLIFRLITALQSKAVKIEMTVESGDGASIISKDFYSTVVLRGSYPI